MHIDSVYFRVALLTAAVALTSCSNAGGPSMQSRDSSVPMVPNIVQSRSFGDTFKASELFESEVSHQANQPCKIRGFWDFEGSCSKYQISFTGSAASLAAYKGITLALDFPENDVVGTTTITTGMGTGKTDITGEFRGSTFPFYGSKCVSAVTGRGVPCPGKALVYFYLLNSGKKLVGLSGTPVIKVTAPEKALGAKCMIDSLQVVNEDWFYEQYTSDNKVRKGSVTIKAIKTFISMPVQSEITFAVVCK